MPKEQKRGNRTTPEEERQLWVLLIEVGKGLRMAVERDLRPFGISPIQVGVMYCLDVMNETGVSPTPSEISRWLSRKPNTITALLRRMEKQGLIRLKRDSKVKGPILVERTENGKNIYIEAVKNTSAISSAFTCLTSNQRRHLRQYLEKLDQQLQAIMTRKLPFP